MEMDIDNHGEGPSSSLSPPPIEMLSTGRSKRSNAGNRMKDLLEQERDRMENEIEETKKRFNFQQEEDDEIFQDNNAEEDIDFEEREDLEDIIDSDFDQSSNSDENSEESDEGEKILIQQEKAALKKSKSNKSKIVSMNNNSTSIIPIKKRPIKKVTSFNNSLLNENTINRRSSKRTATIEVSQIIKEKLKKDEEKKLKRNEFLKPKRKKLKLNQSDFITQALEMEELNRESLGFYLRKEEQRKEFERKKEKKNFQGPFFRWKSIKIDNYSKNKIDNLKQQSKLIIDLENNNENSNLTIEDKEVTIDQAATMINDNANSTIDNTTSIIDNPISIIDEASTTIDPATTTTIDPATTTTTIDPAITTTTTTTTDPPASTDAATSTIDASIITDPAIAAREAIIKEKQKKEQQLQQQSSNQIGNESSLSTISPRFESKSFISFHEISSNISWFKKISYIFGNHTDWSKQIIVPTRNRPLKPRQSICSITGLPAKYKDPKTSIPFANKKAYEILKKLMKNEFKWSSNNNKKEINSIFQMGCYLDSINETGANDIYLFLNNNKNNNSNNNNINEKHPSTSYRPRGIIAPGDEQAVIAAAQALPAGSTRSGIRRSVN